MNAISSDPVALAFAKALELCRTGMASPSVALAACEKVSMLLAQINPYFTADPPVTGFVSPTAVENVVVTAGVPVPTSKIPITFPCPGRVIGLIATVTQGQEYTTAVNMDLKINDGQKSLTTSGNGSIFLELSNLVGARYQGLPYFPFFQRVTPSDKWFVQFSSAKLVDAAGANVTATYTPKLSLIFSEDP